LKTTAGQLLDDADLRLAARSVFDKIICCQIGGPRVRCKAALPTSLVQLKANENSALMTPAIFAAAGKTNRIWPQRLLVGECDNGGMYLRRRARDVAGLKQSGTM
jgi:hypothetical protein